MQSSTWQHVAAIQFVSCAEKDSLCGTVMMCAWTNATVCVPMTQARKAGAKELFYSLPSKFDR